MGHVMGQRLLSTNHRASPQVEDMLKYKNVQTKLCMKRPQEEEFSKWTLNARKASFFFSSSMRIAFKQPRIIITESYA